MNPLPVFEISDNLGFEGDSDLIAFGIEIFTSLENILSPFSFIAVTL